jgi:hypothetical protein
MAGDATGTASGATAITDTITVTGLNGKALPSLATGTLEYSGSAWKIDLATSSLGQYDTNGNLSSYIGSSCSGGQYVTGFSASGTVACGTPAGTGVSSFNGNTGAVTGVSSFNSATGTVVGVGSFNSATGTVTGVGSLTGTANEVNVSNATGSVTLSTPQAIGTGSAPTFNGVTVGAGGFTASVTSTLSFFANIDTILYAATSSPGDYGAYLNSLCTYSLTIASGSLIMLPQTSQTFSTSIVENGRCTFQGVGGNGTILSWNGSQGTVLATMQFPSTPHTTGGGFIGITFNNLGSATTTNPTIAILQSGGASNTSGGAHSIIAGNTFVGFGDAIESASGTYAQLIQQNTFRANGQSIYFAPASNSGESATAILNWSVDQLATTGGANCIDFGNGSVEIAYMTDNSNDNCQVNFGAGNTVVDNGDEVEDAGGAEGAYIPYIQGASLVGDLTMSGIQVYNDGTATSTTYADIFQILGNANITGVEINKQATASSTPNLFAAMGPDTNLQITNVVNANNGFASWGAGNLAGISTTTFNGTVYDFHAGTPIVTGATAAGVYGISASTTIASLTVGSSTYPSVGTEFSIINSAGTGVDLQDWDSANGSVLSDINGFGGGYFNALSGGNTQELNGNVAGVTASQANAGSDAFNAYGNVAVNAGSATTSATLYIGGPTSTLRFGTSANPSHGCIELYDAVNTSTQMYVYSSSSVLVDTSTKPTFCQ